jgi:hypothetical protein
MSRTIPRYPDFCWLLYLTKHHVLLSKEKGLKKEGTEASASKKEKRKESKKEMNKKRHNTGRTRKLYGRKNEGDNDREKYVIQY